MEKTGGKLYRSCNWAMKELKDERIDTAPGTKERHGGTYLDSRAF